MDIFIKDKCISENNEDRQKYSTSHVLNRQFSSSTMSVLVSTNPSVSVTEGNQIFSLEYPSVSGMDSFNAWNISTLENWNHSETMTSFLQANIGTAPSLLSHIPADLDFTERATMFSSFNAGLIGGTNDLSNTCQPQTSSPIIIAQRTIGGLQFNRTEGGIIEDAKNIVEFRNGNPLTEEKEKGNSDTPICLNNECIMPEKIEVCQEDALNSACVAEDSSRKALPAKKRRNNEGITLGQAQGPQKASAETKQDFISGNKDQPNTKNLNSKQVKSNSEESKKDYVHIRAPRGQATNSHSLAERIRRERISERMKFLQDLVPGCSKVSGKAVMLDEIINYVQSLQRQVEFLSMKLAAVDPRIDSDIEALLAKHLLRSHGGDSTETGFLHNMIHNQLYSSHLGHFQTGLPSETLQRAVIGPLNPMNRPTLQTANAWDESKFNALEMSFNNNPAFTAQGYNDQSRQNLQI